MSASKWAVATAVVLAAPAGGQTQFGADRPSAAFESTDGKHHLEIGARGFSMWRVPSDPANGSYDSTEMTCRTFDDQLVCTGAVQSTFSVGPLVESEYDQFRIRFLMQPCRIKGRYTRPVTALLTFQTDDPYARVEENRVFCGTALPPVA